MQKSRFSVHPFTSISNPSLDYHYIDKSKKKSLEKIIQANQEGETRRHRLEETNIGKVLWEKVVSRLAVIARSLARGDEEKRKASGRTKTQQKPASSRMLCKSHKCVKGRWISSINVVCVFCPAEVNTHTFTWAYWVVNVFVMIIIKTLLPMMVQWVYSFALSLFWMLLPLLWKKKKKRGVIVVVRPEVSVNKLWWSAFVAWWKEAPPEEKELDKSWDHHHTRPHTTEKK